MRLPFVLLVCCLVAATVGVALVARGSDEAPPQEPAGASAEAAPDAAATEADGASTAEAPIGDEDPTASDGGGEPNERADAVPAEAPGQVPQVRVGRGNPLVPVAGAEVFFVTESLARPRLGAAVQAPRIEWPERFGQRVVTDPNGLAALPATREPWLVGARAAGEFAFALVQPGARTIDMPLLHDETLVLRVTKLDDSPAAGMPVAVLQHHDGEGQATEVWQGVTDAAGTATAPHFQLVRQPLRGAADKERFAAMLVMVLPVPVTAEFAGRPAPLDPVRLVMPPHGSVEVLLTDHRGAPLLSPAMVALWVERAPDAVLPFAVPPHLDRPRQEKPAGAEPVRFPRIGSGSRVRVAARFPTVERRGALSDPWLVPLEPDAVLKAPLPLPPDLALLAGRIVVDDGKPFGPAAIDGCLWRADRPLGQVAVHTLADGRFDLVQRPATDAPELWLELRATVGPEGQRREVGARVSFQALREAERRELGQIVLGELPGMCSGIVVDDLDAPVPNAGVVVQRFVPPPPQQPNAPGRQARGESPPPAGNWADVPLLRVRTDAEGRFAVLGVLPPGQLRVHADTDQHFAASQPLRTIGQQLRIRIDRNGVLRGRVLLPDFIPQGTVTLTLRPFDETLRQRETRSLGLQRQRGGRFVLEPLRPGRYDAIVTVRNVPEPLCVLNDVFITPGESRDGRFRPLDLRNSLFRYRLRAVDAGGRALPLEGAILARVKKEDGSTADAVFRWQRGRAELITGSSFADLVVFGRGCATTALSLGPGDHDVYMKQLVPAQLELPGARQLCGPERRVRVSTILVDDTGYPQYASGLDQRTGEQYSFPRWELGKSNGAWLGVTDHVEVPLVRSGKYEVILRIHATASERSPQASVSLGTFELHVDGSALVPVTVPVDSQKVFDALASLTQQVQQQQERAQRNRGR